MSDERETLDKIAAVLATEFCEPFVQGMRDRMVVSFHKYGPVADAYPEKVDAVESLRLRLDKYLATGNTEFLMDVGNFAMIEFMRPRHPQAHFKGTDSRESPGRVDTAGQRTYGESNAQVDPEESARRADVLRRSREQFRRLGEALASTESRS